MRRRHCCLGFITARPAPSPQDSPAQPPPPAPHPPRPPCKPSPPHTHTLSNRPHPRKQGVQHPVRAPGDGGRLPGAAHALSAGAGPQRHGHALPDARQRAGKVGAPPAALLPALRCASPGAAAALLSPRSRLPPPAQQGPGHHAHRPATRRFLSAPARANKFFDREGNALYPPEHERIMGRCRRRAALPGPLRTCWLRSPRMCARSTGAAAACCW
jgi:hypothetical protein